MLKRVVFLLAFKQASVMQMVASAADGMVGADIESGGEHSHLNQRRTARLAACKASMTVLAVILQ